jgi:hypothetical protein
VTVTVTVTVTMTVTVTVTMMHVLCCSAMSRAVYGSGRVGYGFWSYITGRVGSG